MVDSKTVVSQVQELQVILHEIYAEGMMLSETFQVAAIIKKLPPSWKDFKNYFKHKRKEISIEDLVIRLRVTPQTPGVPLTTVDLRKTCVSHIMRPIYE